MKSKNFVIALGLTVAAVIAPHTASAHTKAWYAEHIDEAKKRDAECSARLKADIKLSPEDKEDCDSAVIALLTRPYSKPIPQATSAPAPKWKNFGH
ncbi:hypothetical protein [Ralstonia pseudosolanacearum]|uniref:hypothetical protein n=1 Tax=Ralstonia pseudosolanacearum TaxID=1310165 RepID=UPI003CECB6F0